MISVNNNLMAAKTANNLTGHYGRLQTSTERLSSGLRINSASDDAAGLAIRELMRSDIAALSQGVRNANDAISMIQTFDGALSIIDEKLIRMKELAEQAATGTYNSTQRLMIDSEFQAMGEEINRIARATDFNGIKLLDGVGLEDAGTETDSSDQTNGVQGRSTILRSEPEKYEISVLKTTSLCLYPGATATQNGEWDLSGITNRAALVGQNTITLTNNNIPKIGDNFLLVTPTNNTTNIPPGSTLEMRFDYQATGGNGQVYGDWYVGIDGAPPSPAWTGSGTGFSWNEPNGGDVHIQTILKDATGGSATMTGSGTATWKAPRADDIPSFASNMGTVEGNLSADGKTLNLVIDLGEGNTISGSWTLAYGTNVSEPSTALASATISFEVKEKVSPPPNTPGGNGSNDGVNGGANGAGGLPDLFTDKVKIHFGPGNDSAEDYYYINKRDATLRGLGLEGVSIQMQDEAQGALVKIDDAIEVKDKIRAEYGTMQNRLENTVSNLQIQAQNLQAAESRISDTEVAQEMMNFVRNQILTQSAVAMLAQANSVPQMVMSLIK